MGTQAAVINICYAILKLLIKSEWSHFGHPFPVEVNYEEERVLD